MSPPTWMSLQLPSPSHPSSLFSSVQLLSHVWLSVTPWITGRQASLSITNSRSSLRLMSLESVLMRCMKLEPIIQSEVSKKEKEKYCTFSSVQSLSRIRLFAAPWIAARQASLSITNSRSSLRLTSIKSLMPPSHLILWRPLLLLPQSLPASESFPMGQLFTWGGQSTGVSASASVLPKKSQGWFPSEWTGWISLQSKGLSRVFSNTTLQKHQFFGAQPSSQSNSHIHTWPLENP